MANKLYSDFLPAVTPVSTDILLQALPATGALSAVTMGSILQWPDDIGIVRGMGSGICAATKTDWINNTGTTFGINNQQVLFVTVYLQQKCLVTAVAFVMRTAGVYTASNYNGLGIYHISGSTIAQLAQTTSNATLYKATSNTFVIEPLTANVTLDPGCYFLALLYCQSAQTTQPQIAVSSTNLYSTTAFYDVPSTLFPSTQLTGRTILPTSNAYSSLSRQSNPPLMFMYGNPV